MDTKLKEIMKDESGKLSSKRLAGFTALIFAIILTIYIVFRVDMKHQLDALNGWLLLVAGLFGASAIQSFKTVKREKDE